MGAVEGEEKLNVSPEVPNGATIRVTMRHEIPLGYQGAGGTARPKQAVLAVVLKSGLNLEAAWKWLVARARDT